LTTDSSDVLALSYLLFEYGLFLVVFYLLGFSLDNAVLNSQAVHLLVRLRPPKPVAIMLNVAVIIIIFGIRFLATGFHLVKFHVPSCSTIFASVTPFESNFST
jgi:hypothetical protein